MDRISCKFDGKRKTYKHHWRLVIFSFRKFCVFVVSLIHSVGLEKQRKQQKTIRRVVNSDEN